jgi:HK97 family phage prohead protease
VLHEGADIVALVGHDTNKPIGRTTAGTLTLEKTARNLRAHVQLDPEISFAADVLRITERGDAPGGSFGFRCIADLWSFDSAAGLPLRELLDLHISEVSAGVTFPAYKGTSQRKSSMKMRQLLVRQWQLTT